MFPSGLIGPCSRVFASIRVDAVFAPKVPNVARSLVRAFEYGKAPPFQCKTFLLVTGFPKELCVDSVVQTILLRAFGGQADQYLIRDATMNENSSAVLIFFRSESSKSRAKAAMDSGMVFSPDMHGGRITWSARLLPQYLEDVKRTIARPSAAPVLQRRRRGDIRVPTNVNARS